MNAPKVNVYVVYHAPPAGAWQVEGPRTKKEAEAALLLLDRQGCFGVLVRADGPLEAAGKVEHLRFGFLGMFQAMRTRRRVSAGRHSGRRGKDPGQVIS